VVHGFAHLALGRQLRDQRGEPIAGETLLAILLPAVLEQLTGAREPR
jgi:hypothetical protein